jgi:hypothetical protein
MPSRRTDGRRKPVTEPTAWPAAVPRPAKIQRDRSSTLPPPADIRVSGAALADSDRELLARKLGRKLAKFSTAIERVTVRLSDVNGPKGGRDQICQIKVVLSGLPSVVVEERDARFQPAVDSAIGATVVAVQGAVQRRRLKPLRQRLKPLRDPSKP